jgi:hypothetical protein
MARFDSVDPQSVACPKCKRRKGLPCAKKENVRGIVEWAGASRRSHPERVTAAQQAKMKGGQSG